MTPLFPEEIARITGARIIGKTSQAIRFVSTDTRTADHPAEGLFVALRGPNHDGHRYIHEAYQLGFRVFIAEHIPDSLADRKDILFLLTPDPLKAIQDLASWHRRNFTGTLIAITGSNGKTIIKEWLTQVLQQFYTVSKSPKSYNSQLGVPLSVLSIHPEARYAVMEAGISLPGEMLTLHHILNPEIGILSNIGDAHQENFADIPAKIREKITLFRNCKSILYCRDHRLIDLELRASGFRARLITWSRSGGSDLNIANEKTEEGKHYITAKYRYETVHLTVPFTDPGSIENLIHIWLVTLTLGLDQTICQTLILNLETVRMRLEQKAGINGCTLINDFYNSDVVSFKTALDLLYQQTPQKKKTIIFSDILQTGIPEDLLFSEISHIIERRSIHRLIGIGPAVSRQKAKFGQEIEVWSSTAEFVGQINTDDFREEAILLKGARAFEFENISRLLEARVHSTTLEIRMDDVRHNLTRFRKELKPGTGIMVMAKAFTYGSGGVEMVRLLDSERVDYLGVAFADEGREIRRAGIRIPVMVMNPDFRQSDILIDNRLEPEVFNWSGLQLFARFAREQGNSAYPIHLKIDTGMHRLGFNPSDIGKIITWLREHPEVFVRSVFSHLAASDDPAADEFTQLQIARFIKTCGELSKGLGYTFLRHILNTAGITRFPEAQFEIVRLGIGLHGYDQNLSSDIKPVATLKTVISQIHDLAPGEFVGYGRLTRLDKATRIAVIPIGYADGIDRRLGNGNYSMLFKGIRIPTIGNICMDMTLLDVTGSDATEGDEVIVFGSDLPVTEMSQILETIPYEILTSIPLRVKRVYLFE
ncbi:MAG: bifunctional UDP-N-acetylmuramoyl-tripeptide:D-alanyl-D-alanine ligase/alanine racemase [Bacteroidota bacterium]